MGKHIILIGFMGSGKSAVGAALSRKLNLPLYDCDLEIVEQNGLTIPEIFEQFGEDEFRQRECAALSSLLQNRTGIITTGGGIVTTEAGRTLLAASGAHIIWLKVDFETAALRVANDTINERPLFANKEIAHTLFANRQDWYQKSATKTIVATLPLDEVVNAVAEAVS